MSKMRIKNIKITSYLKLIMEISINAGIALGVIGFIIGLFGGPVKVNLGANIYTGLVGGILGLLVFPLVCAFLGMIGGIVSYFPFKLFLRMKKGITLYLEIENQIENLELTEDGEAAFEPSWKDNNEKED